ncbi:hypothetical protein L9F63_021782, partial [Diploptera punctata]
FVKFIDTYERNITNVNPDQDPNSERRLTEEALGKILVNDLQELIPRLKQLCRNCIKSSNNNLSSSCAKLKAYRLELTNFTPIILITVCHLISCRLVKYKTNQLSRKSMTYKPRAEHPLILKLSTYFFTNSSHLVLYEILKMRVKEVYIQVRQLYSISDMQFLKVTILCAKEPICNFPNSTLTSFARVNKYMPICRLLLLKFYSGNWNKKMSPTILILNMKHFQLLAKQNL